MTDLVEIGVPRSTAEQITIHFGNALPRGEEHEPSSELTLPELEQPVEPEVVELAEPELELHSDLNFSLHRSKELPFVVSAALMQVLVPIGPQEVLYTSMGALPRLEQSV